ncbi:MAG: hypothetical protein M1830_002676 [Pleopsidium flavum]|nr:MAG: hypothetical protein M1830_002676 [Pleopsidium flavum]
MSLFVSDSRSRGRSRSPGRREPSRSRDGRAPSPNPVSKSKSRHSAKKYYQSDSGSDSDSDSNSPKYKIASPRHDIASPGYEHAHQTHGASSALTRGYSQTSDHQYDVHRRQSSPGPGYHPSYAQPAKFEHAQPTEYLQSRPVTYTSPTEYSPIPACEQPGYVPPGQYKYEYARTAAERGIRPPPSPGLEHGRHLSLNASGNVNLNVGRRHSPQLQYVQPVPLQYAQHPHQVYTQTAEPQRPEYRRLHSSSMSSQNGRPEYAVPDRYQYAQPSQQITYASKTEPRKSSYTQSSQNQIVEIAPGGGVLHNPPSPGLGPRMHRLSVGGGGAGSLNVATTHGHGHSMSGGLPPGSPLLEAYRGTYQSISPMPSPMMLPSHMDDGLDDLEPLSGGYSSGDSRGHGHRRRPHKRVSFYDPTPDAKALAEALKHSKPDPEPLIEILPRLSEDEIMQLRIEYKKYIKVQGKGINIAKHIKLKVPGNLGKAAYATALGRWESEAHWANFWYQSNSSRRELLIESLMGRTNAEITAIKDAFSDKRYSDSLEKCMKAELKADKFRTAILLALAERRQEEHAPLSIDLVRRDVQDLHRALTSKEGGETAMINIIVVRSDKHLREVLQVFERSYKKNFAREMIRKSQNLVGETLAHMLNGVLNRPVRDALLLHQALTNETSRDRTELLVSRLVRFHWEPAHLERVKREYGRRYGRSLEGDVLAEGRRGDFGEFLEGLCAGARR